MLDLLELAIPTRVRRVWVVLPGAVKVQEDWSWVWMGDEHTHRIGRLAPEYVFDDEIAAVIRAIENADEIVKVDSRKDEHTSVYRLILIRMTLEQELRRLTFAAHRRSR